MSEPMKTSRNIKKAKRRSRRGAALVEAVVTIPFFIGIFVALTFVGSLYIKKQGTISLSRQQAWMYAMNNCSGDMENVNSKDGGSTSEGEIDFGGTQEYEGAPGGKTASKGFQMAVSTISGKASTNGNNAAGVNKALYEQQVQTTTWVLCNEKPEDGDLKGVFKFAWKLLTSW